MFDWPHAIEINRTALLRILHALFALAGMDSSERSVLETMPRGVRAAIRLVMKQAESAARRVIYIRSMRLEPLEEPAPIQEKKSTQLSQKQKLLRSRGGHAIWARILRERAAVRAERKAARTPPPPPFALFDEMNKGGFYGESGCAPFPADITFGEGAPDQPVGAKSLCRRMWALQGALNDIDGTAKRMQREEARRDRWKPGRGPRYVIRGGWPPGRRKRPVHEVDAVLRDCDRLTHTAEKLKYIEPAPPGGREGY